MTEETITLAAVLYEGALRDEGQIDLAFLQLPTDEQYRWCQEARELHAKLVALDCMLRDSDAAKRAQGYDPEAER